MEELREKGNAEFKLNNFTNAYNYYSEAIELAIESLKFKNNSDNLITELSALIKSNECLRKCYNNRSQCNLSLKKFDEAMQDAKLGLYF